MTTWVQCPTCGESDMRKENGAVYCVNESCASYKLPPDDQSSATQGQSDDELVETLIAHGVEHRTMCAIGSHAGMATAARNLQATKAAVLAIMSQAQVSGTDAARDVMAERERQKTIEGWTQEHDDGHSGGEMATAAACYAAGAPIFVAQKRIGGRGERYTAYVDAWPWDERWWKPKNRRRDLVRAAALIIAEIERRDRKAKGGSK